MRILWLLAGMVTVTTALVGCGSKNAKMQQHGPTGKVVLGGGNISATISSVEDHGWTLRNGIYTASLSSTQTSPDENYYVHFENFMTSPDQDPLTIKKDWAITISTKDSNGYKHGNALRFCSDQVCSASDTLMNGDPNSFRCLAGAVSELGQVFLAVRKDSQLEMSSANEDSLRPVHKLSFHDLDGCIGDKCGRIFDVLLETCDGATYRPFRCSPDGDCRVTVEKQD